jgi:hypothetical protein
MDESEIAPYASAPLPARRRYGVEVTSIAPAEAGAEGAAGDKGLKKNAISSISNIVIGVASTAPGYSLAATLGLIVAVGGIGFQSPAVMIVAFIPMLCIAAAYYYGPVRAALLGSTVHKLLHLADRPVLVVPVV